MELFECGRCLCDRASRSRDNLGTGGDEISQNPSMRRWLGTQHQSCVELATVSVAHERRYVMLSTISGTRDGVALLIDKNFVCAESRWQQDFELQ